MSSLRERLKFGQHEIAVCSWSRRPVSMEKLIASLDELGLDHVQLALGPLLDMDEPARAAAIGLLADDEIAITAGMIGFDGENYGSIPLIRTTGGLIPEATFAARRDRAIAAADLAARIGIEGVSTHVGFIPPSRDPSYAGAVDRVREVVQAYTERGIVLLFETGQEKDSELLQFLNDLNSIYAGVNFDPANMILYGAGDPVEALVTLGRHVRHVHIKDAISSQHPGTEWGEEVAFGAGGVDVHAFLRALTDIGYDGPLVIEREAGADQIADVRRAIDTLRAHLVSS